MQEKVLQDALAVGFNLNVAYTAPVLGDAVVMTDDLEVNKVAAAGHVGIVGTVCAIKKDALGAPNGVTVLTNGVAVQNMTSGAACVVGPVVLNAVGKFIAFVPPTYGGVGGAQNGGHDPAAIVGILLEEATAVDQSRPVMRLR